MSEHQHEHENATARVVDLCAFALAARNDGTDEPLTSASLALQKAKALLDDAETERGLALTITPGLPMSADLIAARKRVTLTELVREQVIASAYA